MEELHNLEEKVRFIEANFCSLEEFVVASTFEGKEHKLRTEQFSSGKQNFDEETREFELAEISDFWAGENGEFETW